MGGFFAQSGMFLLFGIFVVLVIVLAFFGAKAEQKRILSFRLWAKKSGWSYSPERNKQIPHRYAFLNHFQEGYDREAHHVFRGTWQGYEAAAFEYQYTTSTTDSDGEETEFTHHIGVILIELEQNFPELRIYPENFLSRIGQFLGGQDIDFESIEFSNAFTVHSEDRKFAYDFCNTGMMSYLLQHQGTALELERRTLAVFHDRYLKLEDLKSMLNHLVAMRGQMPEYLFKD